MEPVRVGIVRPDRPIPAVAAAEARVLRHELRRRLGDVSLDLRVEGDPLDGWEPLAHASWPGGIDAVVAADRLWGPGIPPITALFARTVDPRAAEVRRRMLIHLGAPIGRPLDRATLGALTALRLRATDLWLLASGASEVTVDDRAVRGLAAPAGGAEQAALDAALDVIADELAATPAGATSLRTQLERCRAAAEAWRSRAVELEAELTRVEREAADRLDALAAERRVLAEQLDRTALDALADGGRPAR